MCILYSMFLEMYSHYKRINFKADFANLWSLKPEGIFVWLENWFSSAHNYLWELPLNSRSPFYHQDMQKANRVLQKLMVKMQKMVVKMQFSKEKQRASWWDLKRLLEEEEEATDFWPLAHSSLTCLKGTQEKFLQFQKWAVSSLHFFFAISPLIWSIGNPDMAWQDNTSDGPSSRLAKQYKSWIIHQMNLRNDGSTIQNETLFLQIWLEQLMSQVVR